MEQTYYISCTYPSGDVSGPIRLLGVHDLREAKRVLKRQQKLYPDCKVELVDYQGHTWEHNYSFKDLMN